MRTLTLPIEGAGDETCDRCAWTQPTSAGRTCRLWRTGAPLVPEAEPVRWPECLAAEGRPEPGPRVTMTPLGECR